MNRKTVYIAEDNLTVSFEVTPDKPFNKCFKCPSFRNGCSGPNILEMQFERACEFLQLARIFLGWSYQYVADGTKLSLATVKRLLTGKLTDPSYYTMQTIAHFLVGDPNGKFPCAIPDIAPNQDHSYYAEMQTIRDEAQRKIDYLVQQLDYYRRENENLWAENNRKARLVDMLLERQNVVPGEK